MRPCLMKSEFFSFGKLEKLSLRMQSGLSLDTGSQCLLILATLLLASSIALLVAFSKIDSVPEKAAGERQSPDDTNSSAHLGLRGFLRNLNHDTPRERN